MLKHLMCAIFAVACGAGVLCAGVYAAEPIHSADTDGDRSISLSELLRVIQFYNFRGFYCDGTQEDGFAPGFEDDLDCSPHAADYNPQDWKINLSELLRVIQFYNSGEYCRAADTEDAYQPGDGLPSKSGLVRYYEAVDFEGAPAGPGYALPLDLGTVAIAEGLRRIVDLESLSPLLGENGFVVFPFDFSPYIYEQEANDDIVSPYIMLNEANLPVFITSDVMLHLYHVQFGETLKEVEETSFVPEIAALIASMLADSQAAYSVLSGDLREAALRNMAFFAVAQALIAPGSVPPAEVADVVNAELSAIAVHSGFLESAVFIYLEDYSQYVPRGHYTRSEALERYFRTMMWFGRMAFLMKGHEDWGPSGEALISPEDARIQTLQAALIAEAMPRVDVGGRTAQAIWQRIYEVTSFYVGVADDLTPYEYLAVMNRLFGEGFSLALLDDEQHFFDLKAELALLRSPEIYGGTGMIYVNPGNEVTLNETLDKTKGMRLMGQRFVPDSYMMQRLVFSSVQDYLGGRIPRPFSCGDTGGREARCYPRGLDVMALLGSTEAQVILAEEGDTEYIYYDDRMAELARTFARFSQEDWNQNLYWGWLYALKGLIAPAPGDYPAFTQTQAWRRKQINAALASWAQLRHDTILYAKQSYGESETSVPEIPPGYIEPVPEFFTRLLALTKMTRIGLVDLDVLSPLALSRLNSFEWILQRMIDIVALQLAGLPLSESERLFIQSIGYSLESLIVGVEEAGIKTTMIADVHTNPAEGLVVEVGTGNVDAILVVCPGPDGTPFLAAGATLSYYEFKHPMSDRLTDEAWRSLLASESAPPRQTWMSGVLAP